MIIKSSDIFFNGEEIPIVDGDDLKDFNRESHRIAIWQFETGERYTIRGKKNFGFFAVKRTDSSNNLDDPEEY